MNTDTGTFFYVANDSTALAMNEVPVDLRYQEQFERLSGRLRAADQGISVEAGHRQAKAELARLRAEREKRERRRVR
jgi:hypothetical protein